MQQTDKYKLNKPGVDDPITPVPLNENMDKIEAALTAEAEARAGERSRQILADNGMVAVIVCIDSRTNTILCKPGIVSRGFVYIKDNQTLIREAEMTVYEALRKTMKHRVTFNDLKNTIRGSLESFLYERTHHNPIVIPVILNHKDAMKKKNEKA